MSSVDKNKLQALEKKVHLCFIHVQEQAFHADH